MFRSALITCLLGLTSAFLYQDSRCHEGPSYWCSSPEVAEGCEATNFCKQNIWASSELVESTNGNVGNYIECKSCQFVFKHLEKYLFNEENEEKVVAGVSKLCNFVPATMTEDCKAIIENYGMGALQTLAKTLSPSLVCTTIGMCDKASSESVLLGLSSAETCDTCKSMASETTAQLTAMMDWWQSNCEEAKDLEECQTTSEYAKIIVEVIFSGDVCSEMGMC